MNPIYLYDSSKKQKLLFEPQEKGKVTIYVCGPTVYDDAHLGHARSAIAFDLLHRVFLINGYDVTMAKNFTDVDDKIIKKIEQSGQTLERITSFYIDSYKKDMEALNILPNTLEPYATQNIQAMIEMIQKLLDTNKAYAIDDGVYLDTSCDTKYGSLSHRASDENSRGRVEQNIQKKDQKDFALWKFFDKNQVGFEADFGFGRPGWHIECSAMIDKHLAKKDLPYSIDIHGGGADLLFPHHENEASQSRCCNNQELAKYWLHNGFVNIDGQKMSKSLGNSFFLKDALKSFSGEVIRFYMLSTHYTSDLSFNEEDLLASKRRLDKLYRLKKRAYGSGASDVDQTLHQDILKALNDDMNISIALASIDEYISNTNEKLDKNPKDKNLKKQIIATCEFIDRSIGVGGSDPYSYFQFGISTQEQQKIEDLIAQRTEAKKVKDFAKSDVIRDELHGMGISVMDTPNGVVWEKLD
ncbi:MAG: cysteine--tRNA ligase [Campylobacterales bacterium]|nr:cysteine--tRNA ligase [Campylobacterales bacterium]